MQPPAYVRCAVVFAIAFGYEFSLHIYHLLFRSLYYRIVEVCASASRGYAFRLPPRHQHLLVCVVSRTREGQPVVGINLCMYCVCVSTWRARQAIAR